MLPDKSIEIVGCLTKNSISSDVRSKPCDCADCNVIYIGQSGTKQKKTSINRISP